MSFSIKKEGEIVVVDVEGQLIVGNRQELKQKVLDELERGEKKFLIDFSQTGYIDSSGLGVLVSLSKKIREQGGELRLANLNDDLKTLFELTKLDTLFQIADTRDRALSELLMPRHRPAPSRAGRRRRTRAVPGRESLRAPRRSRPRHGRVSPSPTPGFVFPWRSIFPATSRYIERVVDLVRHRVLGALASTPHQLALNVPVALTRGALQRDPARQPGGSGQARARARRAWTRAASCSEIADEGVRLRHRRQHARRHRSREPRARGRARALPHAHAHGPASSASTRARHGAGNVVRLTLTRA